MNTPPKTNRPLSPHLQVYRLPMTAIMSITHRITGAILSGGCVLITAFLAAAAFGPESFDAARAIAAHPVGTIALFLWTLVLYYHLCNGIRHLIWDTANMFEKHQATISGWVVLAATAILTAATWFAATGM